MVKKHFFPHKTILSTKRSFSENPRLVCVKGLERSLQLLLPPLKADQVPEQVRVPPDSLHAAENTAITTQKMRSGLMQREGKDVCCPKHVCAHRNTHTHACAHTELVSKHESGCPWNKMRRTERTGGKRRPDQHQQVR